MLEFKEISICNKFIVAISQRILQIIYSLAGTFGIFMLSNIFLERKVFTISERMVKWSGYCMSIYRSAIYINAFRSQSFCR